MLKLNDHITVLINTCDAYADLWPLISASFKEYWPNRSVEIVLNTEILTGTNCDEFDVLIHNSTSNLWGERLLQTLEDIRTEYVLMIFDDFILDDYFDEAVLLQLIEKMNNDETIAVFYLDTLDLPTSPVCTHSSDFSLIATDADYRLNSAPGVWRKKDLQKFTRKNDTPWAWEAFGSYITQQYSNKFFQSINTQFYSFDGRQGGAIYRGKWVADVVLDKAKKYQLEIDFSKRGFADTSTLEKRSFYWKIKFLYTGFRMIGFGVLKFIISAVNKKYIK